MSDGSASSTSQLLSLVEVAAEAAVQRAFYYTSVPAVRHGTVAEVNTSTWIHQVQLDGDSFNTQVHDASANGAFVGARVTVFFAPPHQALILSVHRQQTGFTTWNVEWTADGADPALNDGTLIGQVQRRGQSADVNLWLSFGSSTTGGTLGWVFGLPYPAATDVGEQLMLCKAFTTGGGNWVGFAFIASGGQHIRPYFPFNSGVSFLGQAQNADGTAGVGTGIPAIPGQFTWTNGTNLVISGSYKVLS